MSDDSEFPLINGVRVDLRSVTGIHHGFDPDRCGKSGCCCSTYEVSLSEEEMKRMVDWQPLAAEFQKDLLGGELDFPFDQDDEGQWVIETQRGQVCPFSYEDGEGRTFCSVHSAALKYGKDPFHIKPRSCALWPLALSEGTPPVLCVQGDVWSFPCNQKKTDFTLAPGIEELIGEVFGTGFLEKLQTILVDRAPG